MPTPLLVVGVSVSLRSNRTMNYYFSPHTGEHIDTDAPAGWMGSTTLAPPVFNPTTQGAFFANGAWAVVTAVPATPPVPQTVTMRQARLALLAAGKLAAVATAIAALPSPQKEAAQIEWEFSSAVDRERPFVLLLGAALGLSSAQLDQLFITAAAL
jgi:hypothetical protein